MSYKLMINEYDELKAERDELKIQNYQCNILIEAICHKFDVTTEELIVYWEGVLYDNNMVH